MLDCYQSSPICQHAHKFCVADERLVCHRTIHSRHHSRPTEHDKEEDTRSEASNRQPKGDIIGDDLPSALIEVSLALASCTHALITPHRPQELPLLFPLPHPSLPPPLPTPSVRSPQQVPSCMLATHCCTLYDVEGKCRQA